MYQCNAWKNAWVLISVCSRKFQGIISLFKAYRLLLKEMSSLLCKWHALTNRNQICQCKPVTISFHSFVDQFSNNSMKLNSVHTVEVYGKKDTPLFYKVRNVIITNTIERSQKHVWPPLMWMQSKHGHGQPHQSPEVSLATPAAKSGTSGWGHKVGGWFPFVTQAHPRDVLWNWDQVNILANSSWWLAAAAAGSC